MAKLEGQEGIIVAGGSSDASPVLSSVEFFDLAKSQWSTLGRYFLYKVFETVTKYFVHSKKLGEYQNGKKINKKF